MAVRVLLSLVVVMLTAGVLSACGQKGPLYLPESGDRPRQTETRA